MLHRLPLLLGQQSCPDQSTVQTFARDTLIPLLSSEGKSSFLRYVLCLSTFWAIVASRSKFGFLRSSCVFRISGFGECATTRCWQVTRCPSAISGRVCLQTSMRHMRGVMESLSSSKVGWEVEVRPDRGSSLTLWCWFSSAYYSLSGTVFTCRWQVLGLQWVHHGQGFPKDPERVGHRPSQRQDRCCALLHNNGADVPLQRKQVSLSTIHLADNLLEAQHTTLNHKPWISLKPLLFILKLKFKGLFWPRKWLIVLCFWGLLEPGDIIMHFCELSRHLLKQCLEKGHLKNKPIFFSFKRFSVLNAGVKGSECPTCRHRCHMLV